MHVRSSILALTLIAGVTAAGCSTKGSTTNRNAAKERWGAARAGVLYSLAKQQFEGGDLDKAEKTVLQATQTAPHRPEHYELAARIQIERGHLERAYNLLEQALELDARRPDTHYLVGTVLERWQRYDAALAAYEQAYTLRPDDVSGLLAAAEMLVKLDRIDEAAARLEEKATYFENNTALRVELGHLHALRRQYAAAVRRFREASLLSPEDRTITEYLALSLAADGRHGDAVEHLLRLLEEEKKAGDRDDLRLVLGDCYMAIRKPVDARTQFVQIVDRHPTQVNAWIKLGQAALVVGDVNRLNQAAERAVALAPQRPEGHLLRGMARQQAGDHDAAIEAFDAAARLSPESAEPLLLKGISFERAGDHRAAVDAYQQALRVAPADARAQRLLAGVADN